MCTYLRLFVFYMPCKFMPNEHEHAFNLDFIVALFAERIYLSYKKWPHRRQRTPMDNVFHVTLCVVKTCYTHT